MGAQALLDLEPNLLASCMEAMRLDAVCKSASSLLAALLNSLWLQLHLLHQGDNWTQAARSLEESSQQALQNLDIFQEKTVDHYCSMHLSTSPLLCTCI